jgi:site-specific recombinase XerD
MPKSKSKLDIPPALQDRLSKIHVLTHAELEQLLTVITDLRDRALFLVAYRHGLRASEIPLLQTTDLNSTATKMMIRRLTRRPAAIHPLQKDESTALKRYLKSRTDHSVILFRGTRGRPITRRGLDWLMKTYGEQAKLPSRKRHFHVLKHSIATHLLSAGADLRFVHEWLGHTLLQSTALYLYLASPSPPGRDPRRGFPKLV